MLRLVGSAEELGEWSTGDGVDFQWTEGHNWVLDIDAPKCGSFEYKIVAFNTITGSVVWESCENRFLESDETDKKVELLWNTPTKTKIALIEAGHSLEVDVTVGENKTPLKALIDRYPLLTQACGLPSLNFMLLWSLC